MAQKTASRAKATVRRVINANPNLNKFLTLTFAENLQDIQKARYELKKFILRLTYRFPSFSYIEVIEFQNRGAVHFHLLCNLDYIDVNELAKIWKNGFIKLNKVDNIDNLGAYVTKYMTKDNIDSRLKGQKCYSMSKGLNAPEVVTDEEEVEEVLEELGDVIRVYSRTFESEYYGTVTYTQFVCRAPVKIPILRRYRVYEDDGVHPFAKVGV